MQELIHRHGSDKYLVNLICPSISSKECNYQVIRSSFELPRMLFNKFFRDSYFRCIHLFNYTLLFFRASPLSHVLPDASESRTGTKSDHGPTKVCLWEGFLDDVNNHQFDDQRKFKRPRFAEHNRTKIEVLYQFL